VIIVNDDEIGILPLKVVVPVTDWKDRYDTVVWMTKIEANEKKVCRKPQPPTHFKFVQFRRKDLSNGSAQFQHRFLKKLLNH
jgi:hypothetical protein